MCLTVDDEKTKLIKDKKRAFIAYKILEREYFFDNKFKKHFRLRSPFAFFIWKPGDNLRHICNLGTQTRSFADQGIHVFLAKKDAIEYLAKHRGEDDTCFIVPVTCHPEDLIAAGTFDYTTIDGINRYPSATFLKVRLNEKTYHKIIPVDREEEN